MSNYLILSPFRLCQKTNVKPKKIKQISKFWEWFYDNDELIKNALLPDINTEEVYYLLNTNYS